MEIYLSPEGNLYCCVNGKYHRDNNLPAIITPNGACLYYEHGKLIKVKQLSPEESRKIVLETIESATPQNIADWAGKIN